MVRSPLPKDAFFAQMDALGLALTFDDVRLRTGHASVMPNDVSLESRFSQNVPLRIPVVSAAMDTVTEYPLAIALAKLGGLGIIHKNLPPEEQAAHVARVKYHLNGLIDKPICVFDDETIEIILRRRVDKRYPFHSFPVISRDGRLVGILTQNDFDFCDDTSRLARDVMTTQVITGNTSTTLDDAYHRMQEGKKKVLPLVDDGGRIVGMYVFSDLKRIMSGNSTQYNVDARGQLRVGAAIGVHDDALARLEALVSEHVDVVVIDTAHGDSEPVLETLRAIKARYTRLDVVVGNISEADSARRLVDAGADGIKVGQGPGSICTTRVIAGIGCPQVTAVYQCSIIADDAGIPLCADGGLQYSGDITIAIGAGAHSVMMGNMLAGTDETPGDIVFREGRRWKSYRGMGSLGAMTEHYGSRDRYEQGARDTHALIPEGVEALVPYRGSLAEVITQYAGGLRQGMGYVGAASIDELQAKATFIRLSAAGHAESHPHGVMITRDPPNYRRPG